MDFNLLLSSYAAVWSNPEVILMTFIGALGGVLLGAIPGMTATMGVALLIPFSFGMDLIPSIGLLLGIYCGGMYGGSISAILIHAPGTPAAAATLLDGFQFIPTLIGLFAVSEVIAGVERIIRGEEQEQKSKEKITNVLPDLKTIRQIWPNILSGGLIGTFIGAIPGAGGDIAVFVSYGASKSASKHPELYGTGIPNGVAATESANNGCSGGAMIPLLSLGVPGDSVTAILLGALMIHGMTPGVTFVTNYADMLYFFFIVLIIANLFMWAFGLLGSKLFPYILSVPTQILMPFVIVMCICGVYAAASTYYNLFLIVILGAVGFLLIKAGFSMAPMVLGFVLGNIIENNFQRALIGSNMDPLCFFSSPLSIGIWVAAIVLTTWMLVKNKQSNAMDAKLNSAKGADTSAEKD